MYSSKITVTLCDNLFCYVSNYFTSHYWHIRLCDNIMFCDITFNISRYVTIMLCAWQIRCRIVLHKKQDDSHIICRFCWTLPFKYIGFLLPFLVFETKTIPVQECSKKMWLISLKKDIKISIKKTRNYRKGNTIRKWQSLMHIVRSAPGCRYSGIFSV